MVEQCFPLWDWPAPRVEDIRAAFYAKKLEVEFGILSRPVGEPDSQLDTEHKRAVTIAVIANPKLRFHGMAIHSLAVAHFAGNPCLGKLPAYLSHFGTIG